MYLDEIQYFNKKQQQTLLEFIENGSITLIASTTENPYFYVYSAILSRSSVFEFKAVTPQEAEKAVIRGFNILAKEYVIETLIKLKEKGNSLNVLTASPQIVLVPCLKRLNIYHLFDNVWSCDDFNTTKSNPNIYKRAAALIGELEENVIFVDDNVNAVKTAKAAGMTSYGIYDESSEDYVAEMIEISDRYIRIFSELLI